MDNVFICPQCKAIGIDNFEYYNEGVITEYRKITKNGKVSKKISRMTPIDKSTMPWGLHCLNCGEWLDYYEDEEGKITEIVLK